MLLVLHLETIQKHFQMRRVIFVQIWDARNAEGVRRTIHGPHLCGDALDLKVIKAAIQCNKHDNCVMMLTYTKLILVITQFSLHVIGYYLVVNFLVTSSFSSVYYFSGFFRHLGMSTIKECPVYLDIN